MSKQNRSKSNEDFYYDDEHEYKKDSKKKHKHRQCTHTERSDYKNGDWYKSKDRDE